MRVRQIALLISLMIAGCSAVTSERPLFDRADAAAAPRLKAGLWAMPEPDCRFDSRAPRTGWPECAGGMLVGPTSVAGGEGDQPGGYKGALQYLLAAGDPPVLQLRDTDKEGGESPYFYAGLRPTRLDARGRVVEARVWPAPCRNGVASDSNANGALLPGLEAISGGCRASAQAAVRNAVRVGETAPAKDFAPIARWVRTRD